MMKAIVHRRFGSPDLLRLEEVPRPAPGGRQVLVRVRAASVNPLDLYMLRGKPRLIRLTADLRKHRPKRPGRDVAGLVEAVGADVSGLRPGDAVVGACQGAFAEFVCGSEGDFVAKPAGVTFEQAAALPIAGLTALQALRDAGRLQAGDSVLIDGASGGVGTFAVQLASLLGADVTGVCAPDAMDLVRQLGATRVINYEDENFTAGERRYDLILDMTGTHAFRRLRRVLTARGRVVAIGPGRHALGRWLGRVLIGTLASRFARRRLVLGMSRMDRDDLAALAAMLEEGRLRAVIQRRYRLSEVPAAMRRLDEGHARGKIVVLMGD